MDKEPPHKVEDCRKIGKVLAPISDKWTILLFRALGDERMRFKDLHHALDGISQRMLTVTLRNLERDGLEEIVRLAMEMNPSGKRRYIGSEILNSLRSGERIVYATGNRGSS